MHAAQLARSSHMPATESLSSRPPVAAASPDYLIATYRCTSFPWCAQCRPVGLTFQLPNRIIWSGKCRIRSQTLLAETTERAPAKRVRSGIPELQHPVTAAPYCSSPERMSSARSILLLTCVTFSCNWEATIAFTTQVAGSAISSRDTLRSQPRSIKAAEKKKNLVPSYLCAGCVPELCFPASGCAACDIERGWLSDGRDGCIQGECYDSQLRDMSAPDVGSVR